MALITDQSLFISESVLEDALSSGFPRDRCRFVGIDLNEVFQQAAKDGQASNEPAHALLGEHGVPDGSKVVGCIGRLAALKGVDLFIKAAIELASESPDWYFILRGDGPMRDDLKQSIGEHHLESRIVIITEELPLEHLPSLYKCLDIFALPTRREGFGMVFAEAMSMGVPVIAPRITPVTEIVTDETGILIEPESVPSLVSAIRLLMNDANLRSQLSVRGKERALNKWGHQDSAEKVVELYEELLSQKLAKQSERRSSLIRK